MLAYLNIVTSAAPARKGEYHTSPVAVGIAVEDDGAIVRTCLFRIEPMAGTHVDAAWMARYGVGNDDAREAVTPERANAMTREALTGVGPIVSFFAQFHMRNLDKILGMSTPFMHETKCAMKSATLLCGIPSSRAGLLKDPSLIEARRHFTGKQGPITFPDTPWRVSMLGTLTAVREVWHGVLALDIPDEPISEIESVQ